MLLIMFAACAATPGVAGTRLERGVSMPSVSAGAQSGTATAMPEITTDAAGRLIYHHQPVFENQPWNITLFHLVNEHHVPALDVVMGFFDTLGLSYIKEHKIDIGIGWVLIPVFLYAGFRRRHLLTTLLLGLAIETAGIVILKQFFDQPRPGLLLTHLHELLAYHHNSFPSGHTAMMCVIAGVMMYGERWWVKVLWVLPALIIAYQRLYVGVHFPLDLLAGALLGTISAMITVRLMKAQIERQLADARPVEQPGAPARR